MHSTCPNCEAKLKQFEFSCNRCGWSLDAPKALLESPETGELDDQPMEFELFLERARATIEAADYASAVKYLNRSIIDAPADRLAECYSLRGYAQLKAANFEQAENDCSEAIERHWLEPQTFAWRAAARGEQDKWRLAFDDLAEACRRAGGQRDPYLQLIQSYVGVASEYFRERIKDGQDNADMFFDRGWIYFRSANYAKAERDFALALELNPDHAWASIGLAQTKYATEKLDANLLRTILELCRIVDDQPRKCQLAAIRLRAKANHQFGHLARAAKDLKHFRELASDDADMIIECGELRQQLGDHVAAIGDFSEAMELDANQTFALQQRGDSYAAIRNYRLAIDDFSRFLRFYPDDLSVRVKRGQVYSKSGRPDLALNDFDRALENDRTCCDAYLGRSEIFLLRHQLDHALSECEKAVRLDNQRHRAFSTIAEIYFELCDYSRSIEEFTRAIRLADVPDEKAQYFYRCGTARYEMGDFDGAIADLNEAIALRPNHAGTWIWKAAACSRLEQWQAAILALEQAITIRPETTAQYQTLGKPVAQRAIEYFRHQLQRGQKDVEIFRSRGLAYQFIGETEQAIADFSAALNMQPDAEILVRRGRAYAIIHKYDQAIKDFTQVIKQDPQNHWARFCRAASRQAIGDAENALKDVVKAIKIAPRQSRYHVLHGELLQKSEACRARGDWTKVIKAYNRALRIDSADSITYRRRADAHLNSGQFLNAIHDFTRALELKPASSELLAQRGQAYLKNNQFDLAMEDFELALTRNSKLAKAYSGRAAVLIHQERHEYALIWLTKAFHRFQKNRRDLAEVVFARGKVFYQMKRFNPAIADFTSVCESMRKDKRTQILARLARGIAWAQVENWGNARLDFERILKLDPMNQPARVALGWMRDLNQPRPPMFAAPEELIRPLKPGISYTPVTVESVDNDWAVEPPFNSWVLRSSLSKEYGPIPKETLDEWVSEGRIGADMTLLRADWDKWKKTAVVYPQVVERDGVTTFPGIEIRPHAAPTNAENVAPKEGGERPAVD